MDPSSVWSHLQGMPNSQLLVAPVVDPSNTTVRSYGADHLDTSMHRLQLARFATLPLSPLALPSPGSPFGGGVSRLGMNCPPNLKIVFGDFCVSATLGASAAASRTRSCLLGSPWLKMRASSIMLGPDHCVANEMSAWLRMAQAAPAEAP